MDSPDASGVAMPDSQALAELARRASSFGAVAREYALHRPDYPAAAIRWALQPAIARTALTSQPGPSDQRQNPARPARILDLGAGTGKLTAQLSGLALDGRSAEVVAVEPDAGMLAELRRSLPAVTALAGRAEAIPLPDASVDAVLAGQAAHWFDAGRAMPEIARVLVPGGVFSGLWNTDDDRADWVAGLHRVSGLGSVAAFSSFAASRDDAISAWMNAPGQALFASLDADVFEHGHARTADSMIETLRTHSAFLLMPAPEREALLSAVRQYLAATPQTADGEFSYPLCTIAVRAIRLGLRQQAPA